MYLSRAHLKYATEDAGFISFGKLFYARIVDGKNESRKRLVLALKF